MRKLLWWSVLASVPLFVLRVLDTYNNVNLNTGFYDTGSWIPRAAQLVVVGALVLLMYLRARQQVEFPPPAASLNLPCSIFFALTGVTVALSSTLQFVGVFQVAEFAQLFMNKQQLYLAGIANTHFRIEFWCAVFGFLAAVWFFYAALRFFSSDGDLSGMPLLSCLPIVWYCLRAVSEYSLAPVNPNNALVLTYIAVELVLGLFFLRYARYSALGKRRNDAVRLMPCALLAFVVTISFKAPLVLILPHESVDMLLALCDCLSAVAALLATDQILKGASSRAAKKVD